MNEDHGSATMAHVLAQFLMLPVAAFVSGFEVMIKALHRMQQLSNEGIQVVVGPHEPLHALADHAAIPVNSGGSTPTLNVTTNDSITGKTKITHTEETHLMTNANCETELDKDLHDDMLKLVRYKVLFVRREYEVAFPEKEDLVSDNMDGSAFTAWKVAEFIQELQRGNTEVPGKWVGKGYPKNPDPADPPFEKDGKLLGLPPEDKKYLRVYYEVLERYPREKFKYEEQQIRVLEEIRDKLQ